MQRYSLSYYWLQHVPACYMRSKSLPRIYEYDAAGNRIVRKVIELPATLLTTFLTLPAQ